MKQVKFVIRPGNDVWASILIVILKNNKRLVLVEERMYSHTDAYIEEQRPMVGRDDPEFFFS